MIALGDAGQLFVAGDHGSTFGGNPITTAAALAVINVIEKDKLMPKVRKNQEFIMQRIAVIQGVSEVRGAGLLIGIELDKPIASKIAREMLEQGVLVNAANDSTIRIAPALNISRIQLNKFCSIFEKVMAHDN
ncbi:unannotated protein [freshwater metagenome]|uniref:Unannotated protein n=1 Tax=freshwater metagenome TaxID=449393 RepID=A0A6J6C801_9ZZZZ